MLIVFDLDDTLIDTSGSVTPVRIREVTEYFVRVGFLPHFNTYYEEFLQVNQSSINFKQAVSRFTHRHGGSAELVDQALQIYSNPTLEMGVHSLPHASKILNHLKVKYLLALLTYGIPKMQLKKLEKAGIDREIFSKITICNQRNKKPYYRELLRHFNVSPNQVIACGDRALYDLVPAKELGCRTIHIEWGRGKIPHAYDAFIDRRVAGLEEMCRVIETEF